MAKPSGTGCFINHPQDGRYSTAQYPYYKDTNNEYYDAGAAKEGVISEGKIGNSTVEALLMDPTYSYQGNRQNYLKNTGELQGLPIGTAAYEYDSINSHLTYQNYRIDTEQGQLQVDGIGYEPQPGANSNENQYNIANYPLTYLNYIGSDREGLGIYDNLDDIENYNTDNFLILKLKPQLCFVQNGKPINPNEQKAYGGKSDMQALDDLSFDFAENATIQLIYKIQEKDITISPIIKQEEGLKGGITSENFDCIIPVYENGATAKIILPRLKTINPDSGLKDIRTITPSISHFEDDSEYAFGIGNPNYNSTIKFYPSSFVSTASEQYSLKLIGWQPLHFGGVDVDGRVIKNHLLYMLSFNDVKKFKAYQNTTLNDWTTLPNFGYAGKTSELTYWMMPNNDHSYAQGIYTYHYQLYPYFILPTHYHPLENLYNKLSDRGGNRPFEITLYGKGTNYPPNSLFSTNLQTPCLDIRDDRYGNTQVHESLTGLLYKKSDINDFGTEFEKTTPHLTTEPITGLTNTLCTGSVVSYDGPHSGDNSDFKYIFYTFFTTQPKEQQYLYYVGKIKLINEYI